MNQDTENTPEFTVVPPSALESMERASTDIQITTAKKYPRQLSVVVKQMRDLACLDAETAATCFYTLKRRGQEGDKIIQGPSARLAEIAVNSFGNIKAVARIIGNDGKQITAQAVCHDLEKNVCIGVEVRRRITDKNGRLYSDDMQIVTGNAACSIALRNAVFKVIPMALIKPVYESAKKTAAGDVATLKQRREQAIASFVKRGVAKDRIFAVLEVKGVEDIGLAQLEILIGMHTALEDGDTTVEELFPTKPVVAEPVFAKAERKPSGKKANAAPDGQAPATAPAAQPTETLQGELVRELLSHGVPFDDLTDYLVAQGIMADAKSLPGYEALPESVAEVFAAVPKHLTTVIRVYGKPSPTTA